MPLKSLWALFKSRFAASAWGERGGFATAAILDAWQHLPPGVLRPQRNTRQHLSHLLSRNELDRDYAYNRRLFIRLVHGWYQFNPALSVRRRDAAGESWLPVLDALNLRLVAECAAPEQWDRINALSSMARQAPVGIPIAGEHYARKMAAVREQDEAARRRRDEMRRQVETTPAAAEPPRWGTPEARRMEVERIRRRIAENQAKRIGDTDDTH